MAEQRELQLGESGKVEKLNGGKPKVGQTFIRSTTKSADYLGKLNFRTEFDGGGVESDR